MTNKNIRLLACGALTAVVQFGVTGTAVAAAADWKPTRPIRMLVGFAPGGGTDTTARAISAKLAERLGEQVVVDNRPGASGNIATEFTVSANPDGHTLLLATIAALAVNPSLYKKLPFDVERDLAPVIKAADSTNILVTHPSVAVKSVKELIAAAKSKPLNAGSSGIGGTGHLAVELFNLQAGTKMTHVPFKGGGPAMIDLIAGNIHLIFATGASAVPHLKSGRLNAIAITTLKRNPLVPDLPTIAESGLPGFEANNWNGFVVSVKTPKPIIARLNQVLTEVLNLPDVKDFLFKQGLDAAPGTPEDFKTYIKAENAKWARVMKAANLYQTN